MNISNLIEGPSHPLYIESEIDILKNDKKLLQNEMTLIKEEYRRINDLLKENNSFKNKIIGFLFTTVIGLIVDKYIKPFIFL